MFIYSFFLPSEGKPSRKERSCVCPRFKLPSRPHKAWETDCKHLSHIFCLSFLFCGDGFWLQFGSSVLYRFKYLESLTRSRAFPQRSVHGVSVIGGLVYVSIDYVFKVSTFGFKVVVFWSQRSIFWSAGSPSLLLQL